MYTDVKPTREWGDMGGRIDARDDDKEDGEEEEEGDGGMSMYIHVRQSTWDRSPPPNNHNSHWQHPVPHGIRQPATRRAGGP